MKRWHWISLAFLAVILAAVAMAVPRLSGGTEQAAAADQPTISLDMDTSDGPCTDIDGSTSHGPSSSYDVGVCVSDLYQGYPIGVMTLNILYNDILNEAPDAEQHSANGLDDNPDANAGSTKWGDGLGTNFDCSGGGVAYPTGDKDLATGPGHGQAFLSCKATVGPWTLGDNETAGVLAVIHFQTNGYEGLDTLTISGGLLGYGDQTEMGTCNPQVTAPLTCVGGEDQKSGESTPTPTPTPTPTATSAPRCGLPEQPTCTPTPRAWTKTPTPEPTGTPTPGETGGGGQPAPPPPPPPIGEQLPQVVPPGTGSGPDGMNWTDNTALWLLTAAGAVSALLGGLYLRRARHR